jgi:hypothetical protein
MGYVRSNYTVYQLTSSISGVNKAQTTCYKLLCAADVLTGFCVCYQPLAMFYNPAFQFLNVNQPLAMFMGL